MMCKCLLTSWRTITTCSSQRDDNNKKYLSRSHAFIQLNIYHLLEILWSRQLNITLNVSYMCIKDYLLWIQVKIKHFICISSSRRKSSLFDYQHLFILLISITIFSHTKWDYHLLIWLSLRYFFLNLK